MKRRLKTFLAISVVILLTTLFHYFGWLNFFENFVRKIITPASKTMYDLSLNVNGSEEKFASVDELTAAYKNLKNDLLIKESLLAKDKLLENDNEELRKQLNFFQTAKYETVGADVIGKNVDSLGNTIIINRGEDAGLKIGQAVIVGEGVLVGEITRVEKNNATIRLINDNQSKVAATVINRDKSLGLVEGGYGISIYLNFIPQNETISVNDEVVTSGLEPGIPKGLLIGKVEAVEKEAYQPFQRAVITPLVNLEKLSLVSIIKN